MTENYYPGVYDRVRAVTTDGFIICCFILLATFIFSFFENVPDNARIFAFFFIFILYDPIFTSSFGGTFGHMIFGIRVKRASDEKKNIIFPWAILRFIIKAYLGWISLFTVFSNPKRKAIHDFLGRSVVVYANSNKINEIE